MTEETKKKIQDNKINNLTFPQRKFIAGVIAGKTPTASAREAYPTQSNNAVKVTAVENMRKPKIKTAIERALIKSNLSETRLTGLIDEALNTDSPTTIDWNTKHSYITTALRLKGYLNKDNDNKGNVQVGIIIQ